MEKEKSSNYKLKLKITSNTNKDKSLLYMSQNQYSKQKNTEPLKTPNELQLTPKVGSKQKLNKSQIKSNISQTNIENSPISVSDLPKLVISDECSPEIKSKEKRNVNKNFLSHHQQDNKMLNFRKEMLVKDINQKRNSNKFNLSNLPKLSSTDLPPINEKTNREANYKISRPNEEISYRKDRESKINKKVVKTKY